MAENSTVMIIRYFQSNTNVLTYKEFKAFWDSLKEHERNYYRNVDLATGLPKD